MSRSSPPPLSPHPHPHHALRWLAVLALALPLQQALAALTIAVTPSGLSLPVDVAQAQGFFAAEGVDVKVRDCTSGPGCMKLLFDHAAQLVTVTELPVVAASFDRNDFALLATLATSTGNIRMIGRKSAGIGKPADLAGKRVGVILGSSSHYYLDAYLAFHGIDPMQINLVPLTSETVVAAVEQRQVDALSGYSRHTGVALKLLGADGTMLDDARIYSETYNLVAEKRTIAQQSGEIQKVLRALDRAERYIAEQPQRAKQVFMARTSLERPVVEAIYPSFTYRLSLEQSLMAAMEGESRWAIREGHVAAGRKSPNYLDFVDYGPLRAAVPAALPK